MTISRLELRALEPILASGQPCVEYLGNIDNDISSISLERLLKRQEPLFQHQKYSKVFDKEKNDELIRILKALSPPGDGKTFLHRITEDTVSLGVGDIGGILFKIYSWKHDESQKMKAWNESMILQNLVTTDIASRVARLSVTFTGSPWDTKTPKENLVALRKLGFEPRQMKMFEFMLQNILIYYNKSAVLFLENEANRANNILSYGSKEEKFFEGHSLLTTQKNFEILSRMTGIVQDEIEMNEIMQRLYTLAFLHSDKEWITDRSSGVYIPELCYEDKGVRQGRSIDSNVGELNELISSQVGFVLLPEANLRSYVAASRRQHKLFRLRAKRDALVGTHGDAKWDNWLNSGRMLVDFGSAKVSTEYKDIAKALLDSIHLIGCSANDTVVDDYLKFYLAVRKMAHNPVHTPFNAFRRYVQEAVVTESMRTILYKIETRPEIIGRLASILGSYAHKLEQK